jgi:hypothetical protein
MLDAAATPAETRVRLIAVRWESLFALYLRPVTRCGMPFVSALIPELYPAELDSKSVHAMRYQ